MIDYPINKGWFGNLVMPFLINGYGIHECLESITIWCPWFCSP